MVYDNEVERAKTQFVIDETNSSTGPVVRWKSNGHVPFDDMLEGFYKRGWITRQERENSNAARKVESAKAIAEYVESMKNHVPSDEEMFEMRAAFGPGVNVVNVFTGKTVRT